MIFMAEFPKKIMNQKAIDLTLATSTLKDKININRPKDQT